MTYSMIRISSISHALPLGAGAVYLKATWKLAELKALIEAAGVRQTILGSDLGQEGNCWPVKGFRNVICLCLSLGYAEADIKAMIGGNPARLLGLDPLE